ncbi:biorientation of chromosomes in cell division protein 1-like 1 [Agrilus planipennis]|uniref:Biorientation of chromosomes in cell division protein 1-like 1 n=1 Tax=Agrilus planipennis TaxID=224129 RepID=A0A1W4WQK0_AGRPL|nr:biorientation of chromosomes in cell division protein 1-like 1 [Agrilus planipennis]
MEIIGTNFVPGDPRLIDHIVYELKAQGIFDQFRKECIADVDTKPAYQNLRQRVESNVTNFLNSQKWSAELNKNQVREMLRKDISESGFLETGVERIVDQVVNPKINTVFLPQVENVVYKFLGIEKPTSKEETTKESKDTKPLHINISQNDLLPNDLEAISPESETTEKKNDQRFDSEKNDENKIDEDESPPFEPLEGSIPQTNLDENSVDSHLSGLMSQDSNHSESKFKPDNSNQDSQFSKQSSGDGHLSMDISEDSSHSRTKWMEIDSKSDPNSNSFNFNLNDNENKFQINSTAEQPVKEDISENNKEEENYNENKLNEITDNKLDQVNAEENKETENGKSKSEDKKSEKYKSSDKHKSRHEKSKEKDRKDREKKDKSTSKESKERKSEKDKSKSDKDKIKNSKSEKDKTKSDKEKDHKHKIKSDKDQNEGEKPDKDKTKSEKQRDKGKSEKDKSRDDKSKSKDSRDKSKDGKAKIKDKESEKKESKHKTDRSDETKEKSSSSKYKSSSKDIDQKEKSSKSRTKSENGPDHKAKSDSKQKKKSDSKNSEDSTRGKEISKHKKDEKRDKSKDSKRDSKRSSKDDHYGSKGKKWDRRSTDRDSSDGRSGNYSSQSSFSETPQKQTSVQESSNSGSGSGDSGNSDDTEVMQDSSNYQCQNMDEIAVFTNSQHVGDNVQVPEMQVKLIKPKFASNIYEAMRLMKIRKQLHKLEKQNQLNCFNNFNKTTLLSSDNDKNHKTKNKIDESEQDGGDKNKETEDKEKTDELVPPPLANQVITKESWDALEAKLAVQQNLLTTNITESNDKENSYRDSEDMDTNETPNTQTDKEKSSVAVEPGNSNKKTDNSSKETQKPEEEQKRAETSKEMEIKSEEIENKCCSNEELSVTIRSRAEEKAEKSSTAEETEDTINISHLNRNCSTDTDNLTHLKTSLEKLEQDISLITSIVNKRQQKPTETQEEIATVKRNVLSDSNVVVADGKNKKQQVYADDKQVPSKPASKRGRKRKESCLGPCDHHNNNKIENHVVNTDTASIAQLNHKVQNNTISINSKIPAKKKKPNGNGVVTTDVKLDLCSMDGQKPVKNGKKETELPKTTKRKNTTERLSANLQRYSSDDLYKPRLNFNSRRRSARALGND